MKREEIKSILENAEMDNDSKLKEIMKIHGIDEEGHKSKAKELEDKLVTFDAQQKENEELKSQLEKFKGFEEKANKYDEILPNYQKYQADEKHRSLVEKATSKGIHPEFVDYALTKIGENVEDIDKALEDFANANPRMKADNFGAASSSHEHDNGSQKKLEEMSMEEYCQARAQKN